MSQSTATTKTPAAVTMTASRKSPLTRVSIQPFSRSNSGSKLVMINSNKAAVFDGNTTSSLKGNTVINNSKSNENFPSSTAISSSSPSSSFSSPPPTSSVLFNKDATEWIRFDPSDVLYFPAPYNKPVTIPLRLNNRISSVVVFKVKTTMPRLYTVKPTHGAIVGRGFAQINIILRTVSNDKLIETQHRHKFLIQIIKVNGTDDATVVPITLKPVEYFRTVQANGGAIAEKRFECVFDLNQSQSTLPPVLSSKSSQTIQQPQPLPTLSNVNQKEVSPEKDESRKSIEQSMLVTPSSPIMERNVDVQTRDQSEPQLIPQLSSQPEKDDKSLQLSPTLSKPPQPFSPLAQQLPKQTSLETVGESSENLHSKQQCIPELNINDSSSSTFNQWILIGIFVLLFCILLNYIISAGIGGGGSNGNIRHNVIK